MNNSNGNVDLATPGLMRRLAAMVYDGLLLLALWLLASLPFVIVTGDTNRAAWLHLLFQIYLMVVAFGFFGWFWVHGGQTLGMRAWQLQLTADQPPVSWRHAAVRFGVALVSLFCLGLGFIWILFDPEHRAWHDRLSATRLIRLPQRGTSSTDPLQ